LFFYGKTARMLKNDWTDAWEREDTPDPLPMPLQGYLTFDAVRRTHRYAGSGDCQKIAFNPVGQVVGQMNEESSCRDIMYDLLTEYADALDRGEQHIFGRGETVALKRSGSLQLMLSGAASGHHGRIRSLASF